MRRVWWWSSPTGRGLLGRWRSSQRRAPGGPYPLDRVFSAEVDDPDVKRLFLDFVRRTLEDERRGRLAMAVFDFTREVLRRRRRKVAVIADDVFQAIGLDKAAAYVKGFVEYD